MKYAYFFILFVLSQLSVLAEVFYVDPVNGNSNGDGSVENPWKTLEEVFDNNLIETRIPISFPYIEGIELVAKNEGAPIKSGDTISLLSGYHGEVDFTSGYNEEEITIEAKAGHSPRLGRISLRAAGGWILRGLTVSASFAPVYERSTAIDADSHDWFGPARNVVIENCLVYSVLDISTWSADDWVNNAGNGIVLDGDDCVARGNWLRNVDFGIQCTGDRCLVENNTIENFSGDGMRGLGDYGVFQYNLVKNCYDVDANHDDGFQSWSVGEGGIGTGVVKGVVLRGNTFLNYTDPNQPHRGTLQAIGCFDGFFEDWVVENNIIMIDHWHGISLFGAINCKVVNNTVVDLNETSPGPPWILVGAHKDGTESVGSIIRNNLSTAYSSSTSSGPTMIVDHNVRIGDPEDYFVDYEAGDLRLKASSPAIGAGTSQVELLTDILEVPRTEGGNPDAGAFEYSVDSDNDGMPNWWEQKYFSDSEVGVASDDEDADGQENLEEYLAGTDPTDASSKLVLTVMSSPSDHIFLKWPSEFGKVYEIKKTVDLKFQAPLESFLMPSLPPFNSYLISSNDENSEFYRVEVSDLYKQLRAE